jgi:hypothetical protein
LFKVYYKYITDPTAFYLCILDPNHSEKYTSGFEEAEIVTTLKFYETYNFKADGTAYLTNGISVTPEVIIDPDDKNIRLDGDTDIVSISPIIQGIDIEPGRQGIISNNSIYVTICNPDNFTRMYNNSDTTTTWNPFRSISAKVKDSAPTAGWDHLSVDMYTACTSTNFTMDVGGNTNFKVGDIVEITNGENTEEKRITSIYDSDEAAYYPVGESTKRIFLGYQVPYFDSDLIYEYSTNGRIQTWSMTNKKVLVRLRIETEASNGVETVSYYTIFKGIVKEQPQTNKNTATLEIESYSNKIFNQSLLTVSGSTTPLYKCNASGMLAYSGQWTVKTGSGVKSEDSIVVYPDAIPGLWEIAFSSATDFTVTGPNCIAKAGSTESDFYDQTDATDSQILIATDGWSGTPASGDIYQFYISINFSDRTVPDIVRSLLVDYGGVTASTDEDIDITGDVNYKYTISFDSQITIGEAISVILSGGIYYLSYTYDGKFRIARISIWDYWTGLDDYTSITLQKISYGSVIRKNITIKRIELINEIIINYAWDYDAGVYQYNYKYPLADTSNKSFVLNDIKKTLQLYLPGKYSSPSGIASLLYEVYGYGREICTATLPIQQCDKVEIGNIFILETYCGNFAMYVIEKEIDIKNNEIKITALNTGKY